MFKGVGNQLNNNGLSWVALTLPFCEQVNIYNSINFQVAITTSLAQPDFATAWYTKINTLQCPSDGDQDGFRRMAAAAEAGWVSMPPQRPRSPRAAGHPWSR